MTVFAGLRAIAVPSGADYGMQDQKPQMPLHGAALGVYLAKLMARVVARCSVLLCRFQVVMFQKRLVCIVGLKTCQDLPVEF